MTAHGWVVPTPTRGRRITVIGIVTLMTTAMIVSAGAATRPPGTGKPPAGTGIGTATALANPICNKTADPYGKLNFIIEGGGPTPSVGPFCTAVWKGTNNGGATYQGVTKNSVKVVFLLPNEQQLAAVTLKQTLPRNNATGEVGSMKALYNDALAAYEKFFQTYGRKIDLQYVTSSGDDEAAQRADALSVIAMKPFIVADATYTSHPVFETQVAGAKIVTYGGGATFDATQKQAPYRWGGVNSTATAVNLSEFLGKQLAGKKAQYAGDSSLKGQTRKFGLVSIKDLIDQNEFNAALKKNKVTIDPRNTVEFDNGAGGVTVDANAAQDQSPLAITKLKEAGVTTVILFANSSMITALLAAATNQDYHPEWIMTSYAFADFPFTARGYDQTQMAHAFGLAGLPITPSIAAMTPVNDVVQWYWGTGKGTSSSLKFPTLHWVMQAIMYAGPNLTPQTVRQGWFSLPATGGAASNDPYTFQTGYGRTSGLPYDDYQGGALDYALEWWDSTATGPPIGPVPGGQGTFWYLDGGKRYSAGQWPTKPIKFFDESQPGQVAILSGAPVPVAAACDGCPSQTGQGEPPAG
jgi:hypothetical protein